MSEVEGDLEMIETYQFEPVATCSIDSLELDTKGEDFIYTTKIHVVPPF